MHYQATTYIVLTDIASQSHKSCRSMTVQSCEVDHSQFLVNLESFSEEEVVPCEYDLHLR